MMILVDNRWVGPHGIGRFAQEVLKRLPNLQSIPHTLPPLHPLDPLWLSYTISRLRPKIFFSPGYNPPLKSPVPFVFTIHDLNHLCFSENSSFLKKTYYHLVIKPACYDAFKILTVSEFSRDEIMKWTNVDGEHVVNVGNGVGSNFRCNGYMNNPGYPYLLYVGNRKPHKNVRRLLEAFAEIDRTGGIKLVMSGEPDKNLMEQINRLRIESAVVFAGMIDDQQLPAYYRGALAVVCPSLYEGFCLPALEAMACGIPVVTSNITAMPEIAGDAALLVNPYDSESIALAMNRVISDNKLRIFLSEKGLERAKQFSWDKTAARVWDVLKNALERGESFD
jgi:glycosyltransferase involved in cell wall biosynthesis